MLNCSLIYCRLFVDSQTAREPKPSLVKFKAQRMSFNEEVLIFGPGLKTKRNLR